MKKLRFSKVISWMPRRRQKTLIVAIFLMTCMATFYSITMLAPLDHLRDERWQPNVGKQGDDNLRDNEHEVKLKQWERKPQSHEPLNRGAVYQMEQKDPVEPPLQAIFQYNKDNIQEQVRRVTERVESVLKKLKESKQEVQVADDENKIDDSEELADDADEEEDDYDNGDNPNPVFKMEDFDNVQNQTQLKAKFVFENGNRNEDMNVDRGNDIYDDIYQEENKKAREEDREYGLSEDEQKAEEEMDKLEEDMKKQSSQQLRVQRTIKQNPAISNDQNRPNKAKSDDHHKSNKVAAPHLDAIAHSHANGGRQSDRLFTGPGVKPANLNEFAANEGARGQTGDRHNNIDSNPVRVGSLEARGKRADGPGAAAAAVPRSDVVEKSAAVVDQALQADKTKHRYKLPADWKGAGANKNAASNHGGHLENQAQAAGTDHSPANAPRADVHETHNLANNHPGRPVQEEHNRVINSRGQNPSLLKIETQIPLQAGVGEILNEVPATQIQQPQPGEHSIQVRSQAGLPLVVDKVFWTQEAVELVPKGRTDEELSHLLYTISHEPVSYMEKATWHKCGRPKNQFVRLANGTELCARYRHPHNKLVHGELLSFHLSRLLGLDCVPLVVLSHVNASLPQWRLQTDGIRKADWEEGKLVALIQWISGFSKNRVMMPPLLLEAYESKVPLNYTHPALPKQSADELSQLIQWADMIVFDYITANYDRVASMQDGAEENHKPSIMHESIRNLRITGGKNWLIDNESGLLDAYDLISPKTRNGVEAKFHRFHDEMLRTTCIYVERTVSKVRALAALDFPHEALLEYTQRQEPLYKFIEKDNKNFRDFVKNFKERLLDVVDWVDWCKAHS